MDTHTKTQPSQEAIKSSEHMWKHFVFASKICGSAVAVILIGMAVFLV